MTNHYPNEQDALANLRRKYEALEAERDALQEVVNQMRAIVEENDDEG